MSRATIRLADPEDWADWRLLRLRSLTEDRAAFSDSTTMWTGADDTEQRWRERLADGPCFIAYDAASPVGMVAGREVDGCAELISMWVAPEARRNGVGAALIDRVIQWSAARPLRLRVMAGNTPAIRAYQAHGFVLESGEPDVEGCKQMLRPA